MSDHSDSASDELELAMAVLSLHPDLEMVFFAVLSARKAGMSYPIESVDSLGVLFRDARKRRLNFNEHTVSFAQVKKYFPSEFFPIDSEEQFMRRALIVLQRETLSQKKPRDVDPSQMDVFVDPAFASVVPGGVRT